MKTSPQGLDLIAAYGPADADIAAAEAAVTAAITAPINQNQFDALVSFKASGGALEGRLVDWFNAGDTPGAAAILGQAVNQGDRHEQAFINRRAAEQRLFNTEPS